MKCTPTIGAFSLRERYWCGVRAEFASGWGKNLFPGLAIVTAFRYSRLNIARWQFGNGCAISARRFSRRGKNDRRFSASLHAARAVEGQEGRGLGRSRRERQSDAPLKS